MIQLKDLEKEKQIQTKSTLIINKKKIAESNEIEANKQNSKDNKSKNWFFGRINKIDRHLVQLTKRKKEGT